MGAWGCGIFENDDSLDFIGELIEEENVLLKIENCFKESLSAEYIDLEVASAVTVCAALLDSVINSTKYDSEDDDFDSIKAELNIEECKILTELACKSIDVILSGKCELYEIWSESENSFDEWKSTMINLKSRLK